MCSKKPAVLCAGFTSFVALVVTVVALDLADQNTILHVYAISWRSLRHLRTWALATLSLAWLVSYTRSSSLIVAIWVGWDRILIFFILTIPLYCYQYFYSILQTWSLTVRILTSLAYFWSPETGVKELLNLAHLTPFRRWLFKMCARFIWPSERLFDLLGNWFGQRQMFAF